MLLRKVRGHRLTHLKNVIGHGDTIKISKKVKKTSLGAPRDRAEPVLWGLSGFFSFFGDFGKGRHTSDRCVLSHDGLGMKGPEYQEPLISGSFS